jgi:hypothetical protein
MEKAHEKRDLSVRVGQWVRTEYGRLISYDKILDEYAMEEFLVLHENIITANTPQELIEVGDTLVLDNGNNMGLPQLKIEKLTKNGFMYYDIVFKELCEIDLERYKIVEILTPNSNGGYDLQYSALAHDTE